MPLVSLGKLRAANVIGSAALRAEAKETIACSYLSFTLLLGLGANAVAAARRVRTNAPCCHHFLCV
jgi:hypothetical protein